MNGLDLFSGIAGNTLGLREYVDTVAYCEQDRHAQSVLLSRMSEGELKPAPIWDDITTLKGSMFDVPIDIIVGGFPCQDISIAGRGAGLEGKRSGLFFEVCRLVKEIYPPFVFLENVPAIRTRGLREVVREFTDMGYDCRWTRISAAEVGANHKRERWFLLAHTKSDDGRRDLRELSQENESESQPKKQHKNSTREFSNASNESSILANSKHTRLDGCETLGGSGQTVQNDQKRQDKAIQSERGNTSGMLPTNSTLLTSETWKVEPDVGRVVDGVPFRVDRIKRLGNAVVPLQAKEAFEKLIGLTRVEV